MSENIFSYFTSSDSRYRRNGHPCPVSVRNSYVLFGLRESLSFKVLNLIDLFAEVIIP
jgi:hypothetical protein